MAKVRPQYLLKAELVALQPVVTCAHRECRCIQSTSSLQPTHFISIPLNLEPVMQQFEAFIRQVSESDSKSAAGMAGLRCVSMVCALISH